MRTKPYQTSIALFDEVELLDVTGPLSVLSAAGRQWNFQPFKVELVASERSSVRTRSGLALDATRACAESASVECLIIPGGYGARRAAEHAGFLDWLRRAAAEAELVAAIGNGVWILGQAGLLDDVEVAVSPDLATDLQALCPTAKSNARDRVCTSNKFLSARASALGLDLACEIVARCFGKKLASTLSSSLGIDWAGELSSIDIVPGPLLGVPGAEPRQE